MAAKQKNRAQLFIEQLEDRCLLSLYIAPVRIPNYMAAAPRPTHHFGQGKASFQAGSEDFEKVVVVPTSAFALATYSPFAGRFIV